MNCPRDATALRFEQKGRRAAHACGTCSGLLIPEGEVLRACGSRAGTIAGAERAKPRRDGDDGPDYDPGSDRDFDLEGVFDFSGDALGAIDISF